MKETIEKIMAKEIEERGVTISFIARKTGMKYGTLQSCIKGKRKLRTDEFFLLCGALRIDPEDFRQAVEKNANGGAV